MEKVFFKEEQKMHHPRLIIVLPIVFFVIAIFFISCLIQLKYSNKALDLTEIGIYEFLTLSVIIFTVLGILLAYAHSCSLKTKISITGIWISYPPFYKKWKKVGVKEIRSYKIRKYDYIREFYGHGKRDHWKSGKAYTISGNIGLQLYLKNGKRLLIGTQNKQAIEYAMEKLMRGTNSN